MESFENKRFIITKILPQRRTKDLNIYGVNVKVPDSSEILLFSIHHLDKQNSFVINSIIDAKSIEEYQQRFIYYKALDLSFRKLKRAIVSKAKLIDFLLNKGIPENEANKAAEYCVGRGYVLKDLTYAALYVDSKIYGDNKIAIRKIKEQLQKDGISEEDINTILDNRGVDDFEMAITFIQNKMQKYLDEKTLKTSKKIANLLFYRGFDEEIVNRVLDHFCLPRD